MVDSSFLAATLRSLLKRCDALEGKSTRQFLCLDQLIKTDRLFPLRPPGLLSVNDGNDFKPEAVQYENSDVELHANEFTMAHPRKPPGLLSSNVVDTCEFSEAFCMSDKKNVDTSSDEGPDDNFLQFPTETKEFGETETHATDVDNPDDGDDFKQYEDGEDVLLLEAIQRAEAALRDFVLPGETVSPDVVAPEFNVDFYLEPDHLQFMPSDDDGEQYECGDIETQVFDVDTSDFSPHQFIDDDGEQYENGNVVNQFIAPDEAREPMRSDDTSFKNEKHVTFVEPHANDAMAPEDTGAFHGFSPKHIELICSIATRVATSVSETAFMKISLVMDEKFVNLKKYVQEHDFDLYQTIMEVREDFKEFEDQFDALRSQRIADIDMDSS